MNQEKIRAFLALDLPDEVIRFLEDISSRLKNSMADIKWVSPQSMHLTIKFLGDVEKSSIRDIERMVRPIFSVQAQFALDISGIGVFPNLRQPRILWIGMSDPSGQLNKMVAVVEEALDALGFERESRTFTPHLTLGRVRSQKGKDKLLALMDSLRFSPSMRFMTERAILFESNLERSGARYNALSVFDFITSSVKL